MLSGGVPKGEDRAPVDARSRVVKRWKLCVHFGAFLFPFVYTTGIYNVWVDMSGYSAIYFVCKQFQ